MSSADQRPAPDPSTSRDGPEPPSSPSPPPPTPPASLPSSASQPSVSTPQHLNDTPSTSDTPETPSETPSTSNGERASPAQGAVQSDHCYGLPYQDHNYGGPAVPSGTLHVSSGRPPYPFKVRYPAGLRALGTGVRAVSGSPSEDGDAREAFPVIGGLERYLNDEAPEPDTSPAPAHARHRIPSNSQPQPAQIPYYQRYMATTDQQQMNTSSGGYSQHLVQIGGRTYIRQMTGPNSATTNEVNGGNVAVFRTRNDYIGVNNPPVLIPPYGGRGRGGSKRPGRPRLARNVGPTTVPLPSATPVSTLSSLSTPLDPHSQSGSAPMIAPSKGGRPPGRGRGPRRRSNLSGSSPQKSQGTLLSGGEGELGEEEEKGVAVLLSAYDRRYAELLEKPLAGETAARTLPVTLQPHNHSNLLTASTLSKSRVMSGGNGSARTRGKMSPFKAHLSPPPPPSLSPATDRLKNESTAEPGFEGLIVSQVVEECRKERLEAARNAAKAAASPQLQPIPTTPVKSPAVAAQQFNGTKGLSDQEEDRKPELGTGVSTDVSTETESETGATSETDTDSEGEWAGADYVTRCICGLRHNDEFMICCDRCDVWQHCRCLGIGGRTPDTYLCERCNPRPLRISPDKARHFQLRKLERKEKEKERKRSARQKRHTVKARKPKTEVKSGKSGFLDIATNEYSTEASALVAQQGETMGAELLERISPDAVAVMYVAPEKQGLVATRLLPLDAPVAEFRARVCLADEMHSRDKQGRLLPFLLSYKDLPPPPNPADPPIRLLLDARSKGSQTRFVRRSCRPNTRLRHIMTKGDIHLLLVASETIERGTEVTIPFDWDFRTSRGPVECACAEAPAFIPSPVKSGVVPEKEICSIGEFNQDLEDRLADIETKNKVKAALSKKPALLKKSPPKKKSFAAKKVAAAKANNNRRLKIRMAASRKNKVGLRLRSKVSPVKPKSIMSSSADEGRTETDEEDGEVVSPPSSRGGRKRWNSGRTPPVSETGGSPEQSRPMGREERKMAEMIARVARLEEAQRKREEKRGKHSPRTEKSPAKRGPPPKRKKPNAKKKSIQKKPGRSLRSRGRDSEPSSEEEEEEEELEKSSASEPEPTPVPLPTPIPALRHAPPRKRWISSQRVLETPELKTEEAVRATPPSGGTKKRWLRQAMSEDHAAPLPTPPSRPPPKKRRMEEEETVTPGLSTAEAAALLTQMGQPEPSHLPSSPPQVPIDTSYLPAEPIAQALVPTTPVFQEARPELVKKRKKVSLDEYKKRKAVVGESTESASPAISGPSTPSTASFIPQMDRLTDSARPIKLGQLPDPQSIGKGTATFEDLKARIYGRKFMDRPPPSAADLPPPSTADLPPPPPPKPIPLGSPPQSPPQVPPPDLDAPRMSLADRLRTEFGLEPEPDLGSPEHQAPPPPPKGVEVKLVNGRGGGGGAAAVDGGGSGSEEEAEDGEIREEPRANTRRRQKRTPSPVRQRRAPKMVQF